MHYTGQVYRPPLEAYTPLLEVTVGCSHNKCAFCTMYKKTPFALVPKAQIEEDLEELAAYDRDIQRIYLLNGDPFVLASEKLVEIGEMIHAYLPKINTITLYASFYNLKNKSLEDLKRLKALGYNDLYIGVETGHEKTLERLDKGAKLDDYKEGVKKLKEAGLSYHAIIMLGIAGKGKSIENSLATAEFLNLYPPKSVFPMTTDVQEGSKLYDMRERGEFVEASEREMIKEQINLVENLKMPDETLYSSGHSVNLINVTHRFKHKDLILKELREGLETTDKSLLDSTNMKVAR